MAVGARHIADGDTTGFCSDKVNGVGADTELLDQLKMGRIGDHLSGHGLEDMEKDLGRQHGLIKARPIELIDDRHRLHLGKGGLDLIAKAWAGPIL